MEVFQQFFVVVWICIFVVVWICIVISRWKRGREAKTVIIVSCPCILALLMFRRKYSWRYPNRPYIKYVQVCTHCSLTVGYILSSSTFWSNASFSRRTHHSNSCGLRYWPCISCPSWRDSKSTSLRELWHRHAAPQDASWGQHGEQLELAFKFTISFPVNNQLPTSIDHFPPFGPYATLIQSSQSQSHVMDKSVEDIT